VRCVQAVNEEKAVYDKNSTRAVYLNCAVNAIKRLRSELPGAAAEASAAAKEASSKQVTPSKKSVSHQAVLLGAKASMVTFHRSTSTGSHSDEQITGQFL
jgi:hypothetical protein